MEEPPEKFLADPAAIEAINSLDTARLSLRWALERIHALEKLKDELSFQKDQESGLREKAQKDYESLERLLALRPEGPAERALFQNKLEDLVTLRLAGKLDLAPLAARELAVRRAEETLRAEQEKLEHETEARRRELDGDRRRLKAEIDAEAKTAEERRREDWLSRQQAVEREGTQHAAEFYSKECQLKDRESELAVRQARLEEQLAARSRQLEDERESAKRQLQEKLSQLSKEAEGLWAEREKSLRGGWDLEKRAFLDEEAGLHRQLAQKAVQAQSLESGVREFESQNKQLRDALEAREQTLKTSAASLSEASRRVSELEEALARAQQGLDQGSGRRQALESELLELSSAAEAAARDSRERIARLEVELSGERSARAAAGELAADEAASRDGRIAALHDDLAAARRDLVEEKDRAGALTHTCQDLQAKVSALGSRGSGLLESLSLREAETERERAGRLQEKGLLESRLSELEAAKDAVHKRLFDAEEMLALESRTRQEALQEREALKEKIRCLEVDRAAFDSELQKVREELRARLADIAALEDAKARAQEEARIALKAAEDVRRDAEELKGRKEDLARRETQLAWSASQADTCRWDKEMRARYSLIEDLEKRAAQAEAAMSEMGKDILRRQERGDFEGNARERSLGVEALEKKLADALGDIKTLEEDREVLSETLGRFKAELSEERAAAQSARLSAEAAAAEQASLIKELQVKSAGARGELQAEIAGERSAEERARIIAEAKVQELASRVKSLQESLSEAKALAAQFAQDFYSAKDELEQLKAASPRKAEEPPKPPAPQKAPAASEVQVQLMGVFQAPAQAKPAAEPAGESERQLLERLKVVKLETDGLYADLHSGQDRIRELSAEVEALRARLAAAEGRAGKVAGLEKDLESALGAARHALDELAKEGERRKKLEEFIDSRIRPDEPPKA